MCSLKRLSSSATPRISVGLTTLLSPFFENSFVVWIIHHSNRSLDPIDALKLLNRRIRLS